MKTCPRIIPHATPGPCVASCPYAITVGAIIHAASTPTMENDASSFGDREVPMEEHCEMPADDPEEGLLMAIPEESGCDDRHQEAPGNLDES